MPSEIDHPENAPEAGEDLLPTFDVDLPPAPVKASAAEAAPAEVVVPMAAPVAPAAKCPVCTGDRRPADAFCADCGYFYSEPYPTDAAGAAEAVPIAVPVAAVANHSNPIRVRQRYELLRVTGERRGVTRYEARDRGIGGGDSSPIVVVRQAISEPVLAETVPDTAEEDILPSFDDPSAPATQIVSLPHWPSVGWERSLLDSLQHPGLPTVMDSFVEDGHDYLVLEVPAGPSLWEAWDDADNARRFTWLAQIADALGFLHKGGAMVEGIRPDHIAIDDQDRARLRDLGDLLPLPIPVDPPLRGSLYTAPELLASPETADARSELYSFGAMLYSLHVGRELTEMDFSHPGQPKPFVPHFPDVHPLFGRLVHKTFCRQVEGRFPSDEAAKEDPTGFTELARTLRHCARVLDNVRLEVAAWTTTGMVRTGNEDAFAFLQASESRQEDMSDSALLLLADGMGGYEAGEVAATLCIKMLRAHLIGQKPFAMVAGGTGFTNDLPGGHEGNHAPVLDVEQAKLLLKQALQDVNKQMFQISRTPGGPGRRGMGCTAEVAWIDGRNIVVGHVGDSRVYHLHQGRLVQITRDQTLVSRLVELGTLTAEEAETHPRRNELQQAMGGQPTVEPGVYSGVLQPGDYVVVCSDGLTNHVKDLMLKQFLQGEAVSAELAARRLVNLANIEGATDNATVIVARVL